MAALNQIVEKKQTKTAILQALRIHGSTPRVNLTKLIGLSRATISTVVADLMEEKLILESQDRYSVRGRPAINLEIVPRTNAIIGASYQNQAWIIGAFDLNGMEICVKRIPNPYSSAEQACELLINEIQSFREETQFVFLPFIGIGVPGLVDVKAGIIKSAPQLDWYNVPFGSVVKERLGGEVAIINRYRAWGLAECRNERESSNMIFIGIGDGIAAGFYIERQLVVGAVGAAGEIGHTTIDPNGTFCPCGNQGCLQAVAGGSAIELEVRKHIREGERSTLTEEYQNHLQMIKKDVVLRAADAGDELSQRVVTKAANYMGIALGNLVSTFNPELVVLGGSVSLESELYVEKAEEVMRKRGAGLMVSSVKVRTATLNGSGAAAGAAIYAMDRYLDYSLIADHRFSI